MAVDTLSSALRADSDFAHTWKANIAMCFIDAGGDKAFAEEGAERFMSIAFGVRQPSTRLVISDPDGSSQPLLNEQGRINIPEQPEPNTFTEAQAIRDYLKEHGTDVTNKSVVAALKEKGVSVVSSQVTEIKKELAAE
jgi:hypothetical protein